ncbi:MAG: hypothetical protein QOF70_2895 [Acetobacteraceae bacterium]|jgi:hypothetical protein|nr:hypothetical protein [Acetobacteraceae bacterium]
MLPDAIEWQLAFALSRQCPYDAVNRRRRRGSLLAGDAQRVPARLSHSVQLVWLRWTEVTAGCRAEIDFAGASRGLAFAPSKNYASAKALASPNSMGFGNGASCLWPPQVKFGKR